MLHLLQLRIQQHHDPNIDIINRAGHKHALSDPLEVRNDFSAPRCHVDIQGSTRNDIGLMKDGGADTNLECKEAAMDEKTDTPTRKKLGPRDSNLSRNWPLHFYQDTGFREASFCPARTRHDLHYGKLDHILHTQTDHQHTALLQKHLPQTRTAIVSACYLVATASAFYEAFKTDPPPHNRLDGHNDRLSSRLRLLQHVACSTAPMFGFTAATTVVYHLNVRHRFQDFFVLLGIIFGVVFGMAKYHDLHHAMLRVVPWGLIAALGVSTAVHNVWVSGETVLAMPGTLV
ncbi:hypothetical protein PMIN04_001162 [Paraphaeosphaeria minitans]